MKSATKTSAKKTKSKASKKASMLAAADRQTFNDFKHAALIASGLANLVVLIGWAILQTTTEYNDQVAWLLFR